MWWHRMWLAIVQGRLCGIYELFDYSKVPNNVPVWKKSSKIQQFWYLESLKWFLITSKDCNVVHKTDLLFFTNQSNRLQKVMWPIDSFDRFKWRRFLQRFVSLRFTSQQLLSSKLNGCYGQGLNFFLTVMWKIFWEIFFFVILIRNFLLVFIDVKSVKSEISQD